MLKKMYVSILSFFVLLPISIIGCKNDTFPHQECDIQNFSTSTIQITTKKKFFLLAPEGTVSFEFDIPYSLTFKHGKNEISLTDTKISDYIVINDSGISVRQYAPRNNRENNFFIKYENMFITRGFYQWQ